MTTQLVIWTTLMWGQVAAPPATAPLTPVEPPPSQPRAAPIMADILTLRPGGSVAGQALSLATVLAPLADRRHQLDATHAYWRLVKAVAQHHLALDLQKQLQQVQARRGDELLLQIAGHAAAAAVREAQSEAVAAQHELASAAQLPATGSLPLPSDRPHTGAYRTQFQELFSMRPAPLRARTLDQTLPLRRQAIDARADAVEPASQAAAAAQAAYREGRGDIQRLLDCLGQLRIQREALVAAVCRYNDEIADYALTVAGPSITGPTLVGMLITPTRDTVQPVPVQDETRGRGSLPGGGAVGPKPTFAQPAPPSSAEPAPVVQPAPAQTPVPTLTTPPNPTSPGGAGPTADPNAGQSAPSTLAPTPAGPPLVPGFSAPPPLPQFRSPGVPTPAGQPTPAAQPTPAPRSAAPAFADPSFVPSASGSGQPAGPATAPAATPSQPADTTPPKKSSKAKKAAPEASPSASSEPKN